MSIAAASLAAVKSLKHISSPARAGRVLLYDGVCNLCNKGIMFIAKRDPNRNVMFCSLQSQAALPYLKAIGLSRQQALQGLVFIEYKDWSFGSTAALNVWKYLRSPWPLFSNLLWVVPEPVREAVYSKIAANRYAMFGRTTVCQIPPAHLLDRFVDRDELLSGRCGGEGMEPPDESNES
ncbi:hypothetical protein CEUSTIGMA_g9318.t1 [Chlamydomonas eustigma]|uniref:Thiol-disulfide oxidoreductase DCC n=1 Tax=Chlamydomonas eustigma TaxID=1157962 RepID=A0A250XGH7_9CHLO|nr:hypothetical protein CEUSTIGMA_g9318.t1 [Chlamydomonas eustigma]|eukprot:GAX81890.1 hypothetical protein CEUSTIGMA_g9318.t1 [Chlamydomonas eustigma]